MKVVGRTALAVIVTVLLSLLTAKLRVALVKPKMPEGSLPLPLYPGRKFDQNNAVASACMVDDVISRAARSAAASRDVCSLDLSAQSRSRSMAKPARPISTTMQIATVMATEPRRFMIRMPVPLRWRPSPC